jgi:N-acylglucosamine 2-epimerase
VNLAALRDRYRAELLSSVTPFWERHSIDREHGGYFTCLDRQGQVYDTRKYIWLQGRALWMFSRLYNQVEARPEWLEAARLGAAFLRRHAFDQQGRAYFSLTRDGRPAAFQRKPYGAVFIMMGLLEYARASGDDSARREAVDLFSRIVEWIEKPELLGRPALAGQTPATRLGDIMVTAMLALELADADPDPRWDRLLRASLDAAFRHVEPERDVFLENAHPETGVSLDSPDGRFFNPGHSIEMAWFLLLLLRRLPDAARQTRVLEILAASLEAGWDREYGGIFYFMDIEGKPMLPLESAMKLWWPHTEALYAVVLAYTTTGDPGWLAWLERLDSYAWDRFPDPEWGEWYGYLDRAGNLTNSCKGNHYKGFFHVPRCLLMSVQEIDAWERKSK